MKTIVIPSDFSKDSIAIAEAVINKVEAEMRILFVHLFRVPDGIQDLLFHTYRKKEEEYISKEFQWHCDELRDMYSYKVAEIKPIFFYGNTMAVFKNHLAYYNTSMIGYSESKKVNKLCKKSSIDLMPIIPKAGYKILNVDTLPEREILVAPERLSSQVSM